MTNQTFMDTFCKFLFFFGWIVQKEVLLNFNKADLETKMIIN